MTDVLTNRTKISADGKDVNVFIAQPEGSAAKPAIIIIHEWWGLTAHIEDIAGRYAREGFIAVAPDLFNGVTTKDGSQAAQLMKALKPEDGLASLQVVLKHLRAMPEVTSVGVTGFCMGGTFTLQLACHEKLEAAVAFYGDVPTEITLIGQLNCPLLFIGGQLDQWITVEKMQRLQTALKQYGKDGEVRIYPGADHAFFNNTRSEVYSPANAEDAWARAIQFFKNHLLRGQAASAQ